ncbi:MAG: M20/M25/M40 family metallo-hydrolase, partial [Paracoccus sp. (in: a-proteobacteria)]|nr:M20/M25/M40 family metallo-hydrolase [Paracoccus sp. (in: a-proteobacteria)]
ANGERMDVCIVGEPSNPDIFGEMIKIGRRGSVTFRITAKGVQGHAAYPHRARNPLHVLTRYLNGLIAAPLDQGTAHFDPSGLQITSIDCGNPASNVIPERATAVVNIRFNDLHSGDSLIADLTARADTVAAETGVALTLDAEVSGESFLTAPGPFVDLVRGVVRAETGLEPVLSTTGGTSDARFIKDHCPVVEFGLVGRFMHQVDERVPEDEVRALSRVYHRILQGYFA